MSTPLYNVRRFLPIDLHLIRPQPQQVAEMEQLKLIPWDLYEQSGFAYTLERDGIPVGCGGMMWLWPGVGEGWMVISDSVKSARLIPLFRQMKAGIDAEMEGGAQRVQAKIKSDFKAAHRWAKMLGLEFEGTMRKYGHDGVDYCLYSRI